MENNEQQQQQMNFQNDQVSIIDKRLDEIDEQILQQVTEIKRIWGAISDIRRDIKHLNERRALETKDDTPILRSKVHQCLDILEDEGINFEGMPTSGASTLVVHTGRMHNIDFDDIPEREKKVTNMHSFITNTIKKRYGFDNAKRVFKY